MGLLWGPGVQEINRPGINSTTIDQSPQLVTIFLPALTLLMLGHPTSTALAKT